MPSPASGELLPFGYQVIEITGHSDMWGEYRDLLVCKVSVTQQFVIAGLRNATKCNPRNALFYAVSVFPI